MGAARKARNHQATRAVSLTLARFAHRTTLLSLRRAVPRLWQGPWPATPDRSAQTRPQTKKAGQFTGASLARLRLNRAGSVATSEAGLGLSGGLPAPPAGIYSLWRLEGWTAARRAGTMQVTVDEPAVVPAWLVRRCAISGITAADLWR